MDIFQACYSGELEEVVRFLEKGGEVNNVNKWGETPLYVANQEGHAEMAEYLRAKGAVE